MHSSGIDILLHDHLDGSFPMLSILPELWRLTHGLKKPYPFNPWQDHHSQIKKWFNDVHRNIVEKFSVTTGVMKDYDALFLAGKTYTGVRARQGFRYCEPRIAPQYHTFLGLKERDVIGALIRGIKRAEIEYPQIEVNPIFTVGREVSSGESYRLVEEATECDPKYIPAIDLACDEAENPPEKHRKAFALAKLHRLKRTCHASEWVKSRKPEEKTNSTQLRKNFEEDLVLLKKNICTAIIDLNVNGIGHATSLAYDQDLLKLTVDRGIRVEGCPSSNIATGAIPDLESLRIRELLEAGVLYSINPDDDLFLPDLTNTVQESSYVYKFTENDLNKMRLNAWKTRFGHRKPAPEDIRQLI